MCYNIKRKRVHMYSIEEYDNEKTKVLKYALYKKRTIREIKTFIKRNTKQFNRRVYFRKYRRARRVRKKIC